MTDDTNENPLDSIRERASTLGLEGDEYDDYVEKRMERAGFKRGPGEWISVDDDDSPRDDDDEPMTRGDWRRMQKERRQRSAREGGTKKVQPKETKDDGEGKKGSGRRDPWW